MRLAWETANQLWETATLSEFFELRRVSHLLRGHIDDQWPWLGRKYRYWRDHLAWDTRRPTDTNLGFSLYASGDYAGDEIITNEVRFLKTMLSTARIFVDVGANIGFFSCFAAKRGLQVIAVEPHQLNLRLLYRNLRLNNLDRVEVFPIALG